MRKIIQRALLGILLPCAFAAAKEAPTEPVSVNIDAPSLGQALIQFTQQSGLQLIFPTSGPSAALPAPHVAGTYTPRAALERLLKNSGLTFEFINERTIAIIDPNDKETPTAGAAGAAAEQATSAGTVQRGLRFARGEGRQTAGRGPASVDEKQSEPGSSKDADSSAISEVIVTATKRAENIQDVPISITAITGEEIDRRGLVNAEDYLRGIPGVNQVDAPQGQSIVIRGMETAPSNQNFAAGGTTATYFGETPTSSSAGVGSSTNVDIKLVDIERVEVLRGPQGTAFGNSSMGGAVRTIPVPPKLDRIEGKVAAGYSMTSGGGDDNYNLQAIGNLPLITGKLGIRAVAYQSQDSGYYRNAAGSDAFLQSAAARYGAQAVARDADDVGAYYVRGGRIAALMQATDDLRFTLSYLAQKAEIDGTSVATTATYEQALYQVAPEHFVRGQTGGVSDMDIGIANATMEYDLGWGNLLATYSHTKSGSTIALPFQVFGRDWPLSYYFDSDHREDVGEVRLATQFSKTWNFLAGVYYEKLEDEAFVDYVWTGDPVTAGAVCVRCPGQRFIGDGLYDRELKQKAAFGEVSWEFLPKLTLTGGVRVYKYERTTAQELSGPLLAGNIGAVLANTDDLDASGSNFRANLSYKPTEDALLYAGWAQGFRFGRAQPPLVQCDSNGDGLVDGTSISVESTGRVNSDDVDSYEVGAKLGLLNRRLTVDAAVFRMKWSNIPVGVIAGTSAAGCGITYTTNAGTAQSEGVELQAHFQITEPLRVDFGGSWIDASLTEDVPVQGFKDGDRLPGSPEVNANVGAQYDFAIAGHRASVRLDSMYVGEFYGNVQQSANTKSGDYVRLDASMRMLMGNLALDLFVRNLTDENAFTFRGVGVPAASRPIWGDFFGYRLRPRTVGLQLGYSF